MIDLLIEPLQYGFMQRALLVAVAATLVCALLSCWLVLIGWSLMGDAVSHAVLPGVVLAYLVGVPFAVGALAFAGIAVALIWLVRGTSRVKEDATIGIVFTTLFAFDRVQAHTLGLSPAALSALLLSLLAVTIVSALQAVGVILVVAMLIIPGATAYLLTDRMARMLVIAPVLAVTASVVGVYTSYYTDAATGGVVVLAQAVVFTLAYLFAPRQGVVTRLVVRRRARQDGKTGTGARGDSRVTVT